MIWILPLKPLIRWMNR
ncbi:MAG: DUF2842 domain-containing protein [Allosphingosinicella sp.]